MAGSSPVNRRCEGGSAVETLVFQKASVIMAVKQLSERIKDGGGDGEYLGSERVSVPTAITR